jgi:hypothetical protein
MRDGLLAIVAFIRLCLVAGSFGAGAYAAFYVIDTARDRVNARRLRHALTRSIVSSRSRVNW